jgi:hypothetical protein
MKPVTYYGLGHHGQLGAQMLQIAATLGIAWKHNMRPIIDSTWIPRHMLSIPDEHFDTPKGEDSWKFWKHGNLPFYCLHDFQLIADYVDVLQAYYQPSELAHNILEPLRNRYATSDRTSVHFRRGDYVNNHYFTQLDAGYYEPLPDNALIFTNDVEYVRATYPDVDCVEPNAPIVDMLLMASCKAHVIANSSFSWWAAFISNNPTKFPLPYYTKETGFPDQSDFCLPHWDAVWVTT